MDGNRFDALAKGLALSQSRRGVFKRAAAAALGAAGLGRLGIAEAGGGNSACAHWCHDNFSGNDAGHCTSDAAHGTGPCYQCGPAAPAGNGLQICGGVCIPLCTASDQCHDAGVCDPASQACTNPNKADGTACNDGNACTQTDTCQAGVCVGSNPVVCTALDQCHVAGTCDPATGSCSNPNAADGTACDDGNACTEGDVCTGGVCGGSAVPCPAPTSCQKRVACDPATGTCVATNKPDGTLCGADNACSHDICQSGSCLPNVPKATGTACNDANSCTQTDACNGAGVCVGGNPATCPPADACHRSGTCNPATGSCGGNPLLPGTCFIGGVCFNAGDANPANPCQFCDPANPTNFSNAGDGTPCDDGNACTTGDVCVSGTCSGTPVDCAPPDQCHAAGVCDPASGLCTYDDLPNNTFCDDGNGCTTGDSCQSGVCTAGGGCASPAICQDNSCCTPDFSFETDAAPCCSGISDALVPGLCEHQPLGGPCFEDRNCGFALDPACCAGTCRDLSSDPLNCGTCGNPIPFGAICIGGNEVCQFPANDFCPNPDRCVNLSIDLNNCGSCGNPAPIGGVCLGGVPQCTPGFHNDGGRCCPAGSHNAGDQCCVNGFQSCGGICISVTTDPLNCGACGHACDFFHAFCVEGSCCSIIGECL